jgi:micrococcal nuclease
MYTYGYKLVKVVDGDTVDIDIDLGFGVWLRNQRIRLMGIDTPESRTSDLEEKKFGLAAKERVASLIANARTFKSALDEKGKFGRILGDFEVYDSEHDKWGSLVEILIKEHHGVRYHGQSKDDIKQEHLENRKILKEAGIV